MFCPADTIARAKCAKARQQERRNEFAVVNKMLDSNIDLFAMATLFRVFTFCFQEQLFKPILATCTNISLIHMKQCRASTHSITENFIKRTVFTSAPFDLHAYMSLKMCVCVVSETRFVSSSRPFQCALSFGEREAHLYRLLSVYV